MTQDNPSTTPAQGAITAQDIDRFQRAFDSDPRYRQAMNAVSQNPVSKVARNRRAHVAVDNCYSEHLAENKATAQGGSGRCWMFAALNTFRVPAIKAMNLGDDFELSSNYTLFWDKLEKANYFLEAVFETLDEPIGSRLLDWILSSPVQDGGQWHMFVNLIRKYGVVPKSIMPETESSSSTGQLSHNVTAKLREYTCRIRNAHRAGASEDELRATKPDMLAEVHRMLCIHLGEPPTEFLWQWRDKDKGFHRDGVMTPREFWTKYIGPDIDLDDLVCLIHCPQAAKTFNTLYTIRFLGNVVGGEIVKYVNVKLDVMKCAAVAQIKDGESVWFGCDVGKDFDRDLGRMDTDLFEYDLVYGTDLALSKADRLDYGESRMNHAMVFTGVDLDDDGKPRKWRVENSWGDKVGDNGFLQMTDPWFDEYNYEVVVRRKHLAPEVLAILKTEPVVLEPWDPMGSLAL